MLIMQITSFVCRQRVVVGHWLTGTRMLLLSATRVYSDAGTRCFFLREKISPPPREIYASGGLRELTRGVRKRATFVELLMGQLTQFGARTLVPRKTAPRTIALFPDGDKDCLYYICDMFGIHDWMLWILTNRKLKKLSSF